MLAGVLWGTSGVTTKTLYWLTETTPLSVAALRLALGAPALLIVSWRQVDRRAVHSDEPPSRRALLLYLGLVPTALAMVIFGERLGPLGLLGGALLLGTMLFLYCSRPSSGGN